MALNRWWAGVRGRRYWMEITDRDDAGENLLAPQHNDAGAEEWSYSLVAQTRLGDRVLHYQTNEAGGAAIIGWSEVVGPVSAGVITWQAHGTRGRARGAPTTGPSWFAPLGGLHQLEKPLRGRSLGRRDARLRRLRDELEQVHGKPVYFPFFFYRPGEVRARQGYLATFPAELFDLFPELEAARSEADDIEPEEESSGGRGHTARGSVTRIQDPVLRAAIERHSLDVAIGHYTQQWGVTEFEELGKPYDIRLWMQDQERHVEVKGSSLVIETVELTINEVAHAAAFQPTDLVVVDDIKWTRDEAGSIETSGGRLRIWWDWEPLSEDLIARKFAYSLPEGFDEEP